MVLCYLILKKSISTVGASQSHTLWQDSPSFTAPMGFTCIRIYVAAYIGYVFTASIALVGSPQRYIPRNGILMHPGYSSLVFVRSLSQVNEICAFKAALPL